MSRRNIIAYSCFATAFAVLIGSFAMMVTSLRPGAPKPKVTIEERERELDEAVDKLKVDTKLLQSFHQDFTKTFKAKHEDIDPTPAENFMIRFQAFQLAALFSNGYYPTKEALYLLSRENGVYSIGVPDDAEIDGQKIKIPREQFRLHANTFYKLQNWLTANGRNPIEDYPEWL